MRAARLRLGTDLRWRCAHRAGPRAGSGTRPGAHRLRDRGVERAEGGRGCARFAVHVARAARDAAAGRRGRAQRGVAGALPLQQRPHRLPIRAADAGHAAVGRGQRGQCAGHGWHRARPVCTRRWAEAGNPSRRHDRARGPRLGSHGRPLWRKHAHERTRRSSRNARTVGGVGDRRDGHARRHRPGAPLASPIGLDRRGAGGDPCRGRVRVALATAGCRHAGLCDRGRHPRRSAHRSDCQRHAATDADRQYRQRALGHGDPRPRRRQRPDQEGPGAGRARHGEIRRPGRPLARNGGLGHGQSGADGGHRQGIGGQSGPTAGSRAPFRRQGAVEDRARRGTGIVRARTGGRSGGARVRGRRQGRAVDGRDESVQGVDQVADRRHRARRAPSIPAMPWPRRCRRSRCSRSPKT